MFPELEEQADKLIQARIIVLFRERERVGDEVQADTVGRNIARGRTHAGLLRDAWIELFKRHSEAVLTDLIALVGSHAELSEAGVNWIREKFETHVDQLGHGMARTAGDRLRRWELTYDGKEDFARAAGGIKGEGKLRLDIAAGEARLKAGASKTMPATPPSRAPLTVEGLHPRVIAVAGQLYHDGHYREAIFNAYIAIVEEVKRRTGLSADNTGLMQSAFSEKNPRLIVSDDRDEQLGFMWLFSGAVMGIRNPKAHRLVPQNDPQRALEWLAFASVLFRVLDDAEDVPRE